MATENKIVVTVVFKGIGHNPEVELTPGYGLFTDGTLDVTTAGALLVDAMTSIRAKNDADHESAGADLDVWLSRKKQSALKSAPLSFFVDGIIAMRRGAALISYVAENPDADGADASDAVQALPGCSKADADRLTEILPGYFRSNPDRFHMGRRDGISIRYVPGEVSRNEKGEALSNPDGTPAQRYRWTDAEWTEKTAKKGDDASV